MSTVVGRETFNIGGFTERPGEKGLQVPGCAGHVSALVAHVDNTILRGVDDFEWMKDVFFRDVSFLIDKAIETWHKEFSDSTSANPPSRGC